MAVILGMIAVGAIVVRKWLTSQGRPGRDGAIKVLARHYLSSKQSLALVQLGRRVVLLGVVPERINAVAQIDDPQEVTDLISHLGQARPGSFNSIISSFSDRVNGADLEQGASESTTMVGSGRLARAREGVGELIGRLQSLSGKTSSAEPT